MHRHTVFCKWFDLLTVFPVLFCRRWGAPELEGCDGWMDRPLWEWVVWGVLDLLYRRRDEVTFLVLSKRFFHDC